MRCKKMLYFLLVFLIFASIGCEKTDDGSYVRPLTIYEKMMGKWKMGSIKEVDEIALASGVKPNEQTITSKFTFSSFQITFNVDSSKQELVPTTYQVEGTAPALFNAQGYWDLDSPYARTDGKVCKLLLYADALKSKITDQFDVVVVPGTKTDLGIKLVRSSNGTPFLSYLYTLKPVK